MGHTNKQNAMSPEAFIHCVGALFGKHLEELKGLEFEILIPEEAREDGSLDLCGKKLNNENEIENLIVKYNRELASNERLYTMVESSSLTKDVIKDLQSLLELYQSQPDKSLTIAFVQGAAWWEYQSTKYTMWSSDKLLAEDEAAKRLANNTLGKGIEDIINENAKTK